MQGVPVINWKLHISIMIESSTILPVIIMLNLWWVCLHQKLVTGQSSILTPHTNNPYSWGFAKLPSYLQEWDLPIYQPSGSYKLRSHYNWVQTH